MRERRVPVGAVLAGPAVLAYVAYHCRESLVPFALSFALAYLANPVVNVFEARGLRREQVVVFLYLLIAAGISLTASFLLPTVTTEISLLQGQAPAYFARAKDYCGHLHLELARRLPVGQRLAEHWSLQMYTPLMEHLQKMPGYLLGLFPMLSLLFLVPFITFFFLMDSSRLMREAIQRCPGRLVEQVLHLATEIDASLGNYMRGVLIEAAAIGAAAFVGLLALRVDYALALATLAGVSNLIPYAGPVIGGAVAALVALFQFKSALAVLKVAALFGAIRLADDFFLQPLISKHSVHLHPVVYLLALMLGAHAFGFVGLLLGVPIACVVKALVKVGWDWYASEILQTREAFPGLRIPYI